MLVHNNVKGDSRVQKQARSIAELGWDVTLFGMSPDTSLYEGTIGKARVELRPMPTNLNRRPHDFRRARLREPLAYPPGVTAAWKRLYLRAQRAEVGAAKAEYAALGSGLAPVPRAFAWASLQAKRVRFKLWSRWVELRCRRTDALRERRKAMTSPLDRFTTGFWQAVMGDRAWRRLEPGLWRYELALGHAIDQFDPDVIHANDFSMLGVGARAKLRALARGRQVKLVWDAHEYLPGITPWNAHPRWRPAQMAHEREFAPYADAVVTVSAALGDLLRRDFGLKEDPAVVLNAPMAVDGAAIDRDRELMLFAAKTGERLWAPAAGEPERPAGVPSLRGRCGIGPEVPLMVYSGGDAPQRGLATMIEALPSLPDVHCAFVVGNPEGRYSTELKALGKEIGVYDRLHFLPYVEYFQVVEHLSEADLGVIPIHHWPNHEIALITKFFEYSHARLPIVVSDVKAMSEAVRATGQGEVFTAEDTADFVRAAQRVLADPERYRRAYEGAADLTAWTWERQAEVLDGVYRRVHSRR